jgi:site-specific recombinase XerD
MTLAAAALVVRDAMKDKTYQTGLLGEETRRYLAAKRKRQAPNTQDAYESTLHKFCVHFADLQLKDFEPPIGTERIEEFLDLYWGSAKATTYNRHLSTLKGFFDFALERERIRSDPTRRIERAKAKRPERSTFTPSQRTQIIGAQQLRDRIALRLLFDYGIRRGALVKVQFLHFDHERHELRVFEKNSAIRDLPIDDRHFWMDLERHLLEAEAQEHHFLMPGSQGRRVVHEKGMTVSGLRHWWYRCLERADIVAKGTRSGQRMHKTRHSFGQRILDKTGNLKAVQVALGHASIATTGDIYVNHDINQLRATLTDLWEDE